MIRSLVVAVGLAIAAPAAAQDALDLHAVAIPHSPPVADWAQTVRITQLDMDPRGGIALTFDAPIPERWKWFSNPAEPADNFQFTVWACVQRTYCAGFVQMWAGRSMTDGSLPAILSGYTNWWGDVRHLWDSMSDYRPLPGDEVDFLVTAGNGRLVSGVTSVPERSNVVAIRLPAGDSGHFFFGTAPPIVTPATVTPPPVFVPPPVVQPPPPAPLPSTDLSPVLGALASYQASMNAQLAALKAQVDAAAADIKAFRAEVESKWNQYIGPIVKWVAIFGAGVLAKWKLS